MSRLTACALAVAACAVFNGGGRASAQTAPVTPPPAVTQPTAEPSPSSRVEIDAREKRQQLRQVMERYPPALGRVLKMDPTLLQNETYLSRYPALGAFLAAHPEVAHNPAYYFDYVYIPGDPEPTDSRAQAISMWRTMIEGFGALVIMAFVATVLAWLVRTALDHRRWLRTARVQTEVHNKLLDRFAGTGDLMAYVQSPAGRRFLEAAPIPLEAGPRSLAPPFSRILWSAQVGVVLLAAGLGVQFVSLRVIEDVAEGLWLIGVLAVALGIGFLLSGALAYLLSRRLGLLETPVASTAERPDTPLV